MLGGKRVVQHESDARSVRAKQHRDLANTDPGSVGRWGVMTLVWQIRIGSQVLWGLPATGVIT
jgi:hypothetical protein